MATKTPTLHISGLRDYDILQLLGEGGMGKVFLARHQRTGDLAVVKTIHQHLQNDAKVRQRFFQEIELMRRFRHPNAVALLEAGPAEAEEPFFVMEFVRGVSLDEMLRTETRFTPLRTGTFLAPLCLFLQAAHDNGLLHRDLTPANIMVIDANTPQEDIKVMDFGLARRIGFYIPAGQLKSDDGSIDGGTPDYVCPEQILGLQVDQRGDLYSVGVLLYGLLTGHLPFEVLTDPMQILAANLHQKPPDFAHWGVHTVPPAIEKLVLSCLSKSAKDRPASARALIETYQQIVRHRFVDDAAFAESMGMAISTLCEINILDPRSVIDQFNATMVEQVAAMKLRGFVDGVGGQVIESDAGVIKVLLPRVVEVQGKKTIWNLFKPEVKQQIDWVGLELHMAKKMAESREVVDITVVRPLVPSENLEQTRTRKLFCEVLCRELRAYLMVGR